jgi:hypothetical protein
MTTPDPRPVTTTYTEQLTDPVSGDVLTFEAASETELETKIADHLGPEQA